MEAAGGGKEEGSEVRTEILNRRAFFFLYERMCDSQLMEGTATAAAAIIGEAKVYRPRPAMGLLLT